MIKHFYSQTDAHEYVKWNGGKLIQGDKGFNSVLIEDIGGIVTCASSEFVSRKTVFDYQRELAK